MPVEYGDSGSLLQIPVDDSAEPNVPTGDLDDLKDDRAAPLSRWRLHATSSDG